MQYNKTHYEANILTDVSHHISQLHVLTNFYGAIFRLLMTFSS
jgi:hypothetical protein